MRESDCRERRFSVFVGAPLSLKLGKGSKHCTREHCKARTKAGGRTNPPQEALRISRVHGGLGAFRFEKKENIGPLLRASLPSCRKD